MYWWGLVILSIAVGHRYEQIDGWMVLGGGMVLFVLLRAVFLRIPVTRKD
jgi:hypothetical protein